ncbi:protein phosphatase 2C domain-containing protein [Candidatus Uhrbacteria bacterium]|nr:protein phosphatase 2C domain-containing protein [Candidatus Uhrbacteria bacterium]
MPKKTGGPERPSTRPTDPEALTTKPTIKKAVETEPLPGIRIWEASYEKDIGKPNEDAVFQDLDDQGRCGTFLVSDGIGGKACGEVASGLIRDRVRAEQGQIRGIQRLRRANSEDEVTGLDGEPIREEQILKETLEAAHRDILETGKKEIDKLGMGATATLARLIERPSDGAKELAFAHCGDTRLSLLHADGTLGVLTLDMHPVLEVLKDRHGIEIAMGVQAMLDEIGNSFEYKKLIEAWPSELPSGIDYALFDKIHPFLSLELAKVYFNLRARVEYTLGGTLKIQTGRIEVPSGSRIILTTDGIHDNLFGREIAAILSGDFDKIEDLEIRHSAELADRPTDRLIWAAQARAAELGAHPRSKGRDDMSVIIVEI